MVHLFTALLVLSHFNPALPKAQDFANRSRPELVKMLSSACLGFFKKPEFQSYDLSELMQTLVKSATAPRTQKDPSLSQSGVTGPQAAELYGKICKATPELSALDPYVNELAEAVKEYNALKEDLPQVVDLRRIELPQATDILANDGGILDEIYIKEGRRRSISIDSLPSYVPKAFVAVEDTRFFEHKGIDEIGILRVLARAMAGKSGRQGASTITQQVARNLYLTPEPTLKRKLQEILLAEKIERQLSKKEILELYINLIYFGRNAWGIEKAAESYFGKRAKNLTAVEAAFLVGVVHGPNLYRGRRDRIEARTEFVLEKMREKSVIAKKPVDLRKELRVLPSSDPYNTGYIRDLVAEDTRRLNPNWMLNPNIDVQTSIDPKLQLSAAQALQEGLIRFERSQGPSSWRGPLGNINEQIVANTQATEERNRLNKLAKEKASESLFSGMVKEEEPEAGPVRTEYSKPWQLPLIEASNKFFPPVSTWELAVVLNGKGRIGLSDGSEKEVTAESLRWMGSLNTGDLIFVRSDARGNRWEGVQVPRINGAAMVMNSETGQVLALVGGFSYALSGYNRAMLAQRQPGSLLKPFTYLAALQAGVQPNTMLPDAPIVFPPLSRGGQSWSPENYGGENGEPRPMRWAIENSRNVMTAYLMSQIGLNPIRALTQEFGIYENPERVYPFILGAQVVTLSSMVRAYSAIGNGGRLVPTRLIDRVLEKNQSAKEISYGKPTPIRGVDAISLFQLRYLMQGVVERGTAARLSKYAKYMAGKTGTTNDSKDVWFIGFTPRLAIGVYIGYDAPESLGTQATGAGVALPIFERILTTSFEGLYLPEIFPPAPRGVVFLPTNRLTGEISKQLSKDSFLEAYRESAVKEYIK